MWLCCVSWLTKLCILGFSKHSFWRAKQWVLYRRGARRLFHISLRCFPASLSASPRKNQIEDEIDSKMHLFSSANTQPCYGREEDWSCFVFSLQTTAALRLLLTWCILIKMRKLMSHLSVSARIQILIKPKCLQETSLQLIYLHQDKQTESIQDIVLIIWSLFVSQKKIQIQRHISRRSARKYCSFRKSTAYTFQLAH